MRLNRRQALLGASATLAMPWVRPSWAQGGTVNVYNWADYIGETTLADFTAETGIEVVYDLYASAEEMQAKLLAGSTGYDVVLHSGQGLPRSIEAGVLQKIDRSKLTNWDNLDPGILKTFALYDPNYDYNVPYMWGSVGMTYNIDMVKERIPDADLESLDLIMKPEFAALLADCGISLLDSPNDIGYMILSYLGIDPNTAGPAEWAKLVEAVKPVREYIATFDNANYLTAIPNGELCAVNNWSGDYGVAKARAAEAGIEMNLGYFVPKTGAPAWFDVWAVPADAPNVENAHLFLNYMLRPEVIAAATNFTGYGNVNKAATAFVDPAILADPAVYPNAEAIARLYTPLPQSIEQETDLNRAWTDIKTGG
jgi:putrescine transport system substrate-binding protein